MSRTTIFKSNRSQAVRLPKAVAFPETVRTVVVTRAGRSLMITPADVLWDDFFEAPGIDLPEREQPGPQARDGF